MTEAEILSKIVELARDELDYTGPLGPTSHLVEDLELDSIRRLTLAIEVEDHFRICLDPEEESQIETVADLVAVVRRKLATR